MRLVILQGPKCFRITVPHRRDYFASLPFISRLGSYMIPFEPLNPTNHNSPVHEVFYNSPKGENAAIPPSNTHARAPPPPVIHHGRFFRHGIPFPHFLVISFLDTIKKLPYINTFISSIYLYYCMAKPLTSKSPPPTNESQHILQCLEIILPLSALEFSFRELDMRQRCVV